MRDEAQEETITMENDVQDADEWDGVDGVEGRATAPRLGPPRRDPMALGFGAAFLGLGVLGVLRAAGVDVPVAWLYAAVLVGLGLAGLVSAQRQA